MNEADVEHILHFIALREGTTPAQARSMFGSGWTYFVSLEALECGWRDPLGYRPPRPS